MFPVIHYDNLYVHTYLYKCVVKLLKGGETQEEKRLLCLKIAVKSCQFYQKLIQFFVSFRVYLRKIKCEKEIKVIVNSLGLHG